MPLQLLLQAQWEQSYGWSQVPKVVTVLRVVSVLATSVCCFFALWQLCRERWDQCRAPSKRIAAKFSARMVRQIVFVPLLLSVFSMLSLFFPAQAYGLELVISIGTVLQVSAVLYHCLDAFGDPPDTEKVVAKLPARRWWCGSGCGGFADAMPWLSFFIGQSKKAKKITIRQLTVAYYMVDVWIWVTIYNACTTLFWTTWPKHMYLIDGWCHGLPQMPKGQSIFNTTVAIWSGLFGMSGFGVVAGASSLAAARGMGAAVSKKIMARSSLAQLYVSIPLFKALLYLLPIGFRTPTIEYFTPFRSNQTWALRNFTGADPVGTPALQTSETYGVFYTCPLYDREVINLMIYSTLVSLLMAFVAYRNWKLNPISEWGQALKVDLKDSDDEGDGNCCEAQESEETSGSEVEA